MRPLPRVKFIWGAGKVIRGRWYFGLFGFYDRVEGEPDSGLAISLRGAAGWGALCGALAYVAGATVLHSIWEKNPYNRLTYADALLYPLRRQSIAEKKGQAFIEQGQAYFLEKKYQDAANLLRLGLARHPRDLSARVTLAQFYLMANQRPLALKVLEEGLALEPNPGSGYLDTLFITATQAEDFDTVVKVADQLLARGEGKVALSRASLLERKFAALMAQGRHAEALAMAEQGNDPALATEQRVVALLALNRAEDARTALAEAQRRNVGELLVKRLAARVAREAKRYDEMNQALGELRARAPADPAPLVYAIVQRAMAGRADEAATALEDYLFRFGGDGANLQLVAEPLGEIRSLPLLERCLAAAKERGYPLQRIESLIVQTHVFRGDWDRASRVLAGIVVPRNEPLVGVLWREWISKLIEAGRSPTDAAQMALVEFLRQRPWPASMFRQSIETLRDHGRPEAARDVLALATRVFPASAWFQAEAAKLAPKAAVTPDATATVAGAGAPANDLPDEAAYWERLNTLLAGQRWAEVSAQIQAARAARPVPEWLARREPDLRLAQVRAGLGLGDKVAMVGAARHYLNGDAHRSQHIVTIAEAAVERGDKENAVALTREVLRRVPDFEDAKVLLARLQPQG